MMDSAKLPELVKINTELNDLSSPSHSFIMYRVRKNIMEKNCVGI